MPHYPLCIHVVVSFLVLVIKLPGTGGFLVLSTHTSSTELGTKICASQGFSSPLTQSHSSRKPSQPGATSQPYQPQSSWSLASRPGW